MDKLKQLCLSLKDMPGNYAIKNIDGVYQQISRGVSELLGFKEPEEIIGLTDFDLPCGASKNAEKYIKNDQLAIKSKKRLKEICIDHYQNGWHGLLGEVNPILDADNTLYGLYTYCIDVTQTDMFNYIIQLRNNDIKQYIGGNESVLYLLENNIDSEKYPLSDRLHECLFYILRGKSASDIGKLLHLSPRTIHGYIENLKRVFHCGTKSQLIESAVDKGFINTIPQRLLEKKLIIM